MKTLRIELSPQPATPAPVEGVGRLYKTREIREALQVSEVTVGNWIRTGQLEARRVGGQWRVSEEALLRFLNERPLPKVEGKRGRGRPKAPPKDEAPEGWKRTRLKPPTSTNNE